MDCMVYRGMDCMVDMSMDSMVDRGMMNWGMVNRGMDCMVYRGMDCMVDRSMDSMVDRGMDCMVNSSWGMGNNGTSCKSSKWNLCVSRHKSYKSSQYKTSEGPLRYPLLSSDPPSPMMLRDIRNQLRSE